MISKDYLSGYNAQPTSVAEAPAWSPSTVGKKTVQIGADGSYKQIDENQAPVGAPVPNYSQDFSYGGLNTPPEWAFASNAYGQMFDQKGMPIDTSGIFEAAMNKGKFNLKETAAGLAEQYGMGGLRWSEPFLDSLSYETQRMMSDAAMQQAMADLGAQESGMQRAFGAIGGAGQMGDRYWNAPFQTSQAAMQNAMLMHQMQRENLADEYNYAINPWEREWMKWGQNVEHGYPMYPPSGAAVAAGGAAPWLAQAGQGIWNNLFNNPSRGMIEPNFGPLPGMQTTQMTDTWTPPAHDMSGVY